MSQMGEALEQAGRYLTEPHAQVVRPGDGDHDGPEDNPRAAALLGKHADDVNGPGVLVINLPCEEGYRCPECADPEGPAIDWDRDERLAWSEYRGMLWCYVCERDYPSALCLAHDPTRATEVFLDTLAQSVERRAAELQQRAAPWAHELAEADKTITSLDGAPGDSVGAPLPERIGRLYGTSFGSGFVAGERSLAARTTDDALFRAIYPDARPDEEVGARRRSVQAVRSRLASELRWPE